MIVLILLVFAIMIVLEVPRLVQQKMWRELVAFGVLTVFAFYMSLATMYNWPLPNPNGVLRAIFVPVSNYVNKIL